MKLTPFQQVDDTPFTLGVDELLARRGTPARQGRNAVALNEYDYGDVIYRFQENGRLEEVTRRAPVLHVGELAIPFPALEGFVRKQDPTAFSRAGFVISPAYGIAFAPDAPDWVTALARHCIETWRSLA